ncbi:mitochondrial carrier [Schizophyllum commune Tattone D]|nr:mitochondrial carrier [Schizophyllum commune Tattone D]
MGSSQEWISPEAMVYFFAGGCAGAASRTVVSPLERLKIIQQIQPPGENQYKGVFRSLVRMWKEEGVRGYMRGNGVNCLRIVPYSAVQFSTYEHLKKAMVQCKWLYNTRYPNPTDVWCIASVSTTYPLDLVRTRLSIATASINSGAARVTSASAPSTATPQAILASAAASTSPQAKVSLASAYHTSSLKHYRPQDLSIWGMTQKIIREEGGVRALYRGIVATAMGVAPYVGINFAAYEALRGIITPPGQTSVPRKLLCGALAGVLTLTYPFDVLRRKMQVAGIKSEALNQGVQYNGALQAMVGILRTEGLRGLYKGLWPNLLKVAPSISTSFFTYELVKEFCQARILA